MAVFVLNELLEIWLQQAEEALVYRYNEMGLKASGNFEKNINSKLTVSDGKYVGVITAPDYIGALTNGIKPHYISRSFIENLVEWIDAKGIRTDNAESFAWAIAKKQEKQGLLVPNVRNDGTLISGTFTNERMDALYKGINTVVIKGIGNHFKEIIKK